MVARLIIDYVRRGGRQAGLFVVLALLLMALTLATGMVSPESFVAVSMIVAFALALPTIMALTPREVLQLPLSRRDVWRARWIASVPLPTIALAIGKALVYWMPMTAFASVAGGEALSGQTMILSSLLDLAYLGVMFRVMILMAARSSRPQATSRSTLVVRLTFIGGLGWPWLIARWMPLRFSDLWSTSGLLLAAGVANAIAGYFHQPGATPHQRRFAVASDQVEPSAQVPTSRGYLTALPLLLWREARSVSSGTLMMVGLLAVMNWFEPSLMSFYSTAADDNPTFLFLWMAAMTFAGPAIQSLRQIRVMPMTIQTLENIFLGRALLGTALLGACWWLAWRIKTGHASPFMSLPMLLLFLGIKILGDVTDIRWQNRNLLKMPIMLSVFLGGAVIAALTAKHGIPYVFPAYSVCTVVAAWTALHRTLTRSSVAYKPRKLILPFGVAPGT